MHYRVDIRPAGRSRSVRSARVRDCGLGCRCQRALLIDNPNVRIAPCTMRGHVRGAWIDGCARIVEMTMLPVVSSYSHKTTAC